MTEAQQTENKLVYIIKDHPVCILKQICILWKKKQLCDVVFYTDDSSRVTAWAHKVVLTASSKMLQNVHLGMESGRMLKIFLPKGIKESIIDQLLQCLYEGVLKITDSSVYDLLAIATLLEISQVKKFCEEFCAKFSLPLSSEDKLKPDDVEIRYVKELSLSSKKAAADSLYMENCSDQSSNNNGSVHSDHRGMIADYRKDVMISESSFHSDVQIQDSMDSHMRDSEQIVYGLSSSETTVDNLNTNKPQNEPPINNLEVRSPQQPCSRTVSEKEGPCSSYNETTEPCIKKSSVRNTYEGSPFKTSYTVLDVSNILASDVTTNSRTELTCSGISSTDTCHSLSVTDSPQQKFSAHLSRGNNRGQHSKSDNTKPTDDAVSLTEDAMSLTEDAMSEAECKQQNDTASSQVCMEDTPYIKQTADVNSQPMRSNEPCTGDTVLENNCQSKTSKPTNMDDLSSAKDSSQKYAQSLSSSDSHSTELHLEHDTHAKVANLVSDIDGCSSESQVDNELCGLDSAAGILPNKDCSEPSKQGGSCRGEDNNTEIFDDHTYSASPQSVQFTIVPPMRKDPLRLDTEKMVVVKIVDNKIKRVLGNESQQELDEIFNVKTLRDSCNKSGESLNKELSSEEQSTTQDINRKGKRGRKKSNMQNTTSTTADVSNGSPSSGRKRRECVESNQGRDVKKAKQSSGNAASGFQSPYSLRKRKLNIVNGKSTKSEELPKKLNSKEKKCLDTGDVNEKKSRQRRKMDKPELELDIAVETEDLVIKTEPEGSFGNTFIAVPFYTETGESSEENNAVEMGDNSEISASIQELPYLQIKEEELESDDKIREDNVHVPVSTSACAPPHTTSDRIHSDTEMPVLTPIISDVWSIAKDSHVHPPENVSTEKQLTVSTTSALEDSCDHNFVSENECEHSSLFSGPVPQHEKLTDAGKTFGTNNGTTAEPAKLPTQAIQVTTPNVEAIAADRKQANTGQDNSIKNAVNTFTSEFDKDPPTKRSLTTGNENTLNTDISEALESGSDDSASKPQSPSVTRDMCTSSKNWPVNDNGIYSLSVLADTASQMLAIKESAAEKSASMVIISPDEIQLKKLPERSGLTKENLDINSKQDGQMTSILKTNACPRVVVPSTPPVKYSDKTSVSSHSLMAASPPSTCSANAEQLEGADPVCDKQEENRLNETGDNNRSLRSKPACVIVYPDKTVENSKYKHGIDCSKNSSTHASEDNEKAFMRPTVLQSEAQYVEHDYTTVENEVTIPLETSDDLVVNSSGFSSEENPMKQASGHNDHDYDLHLSEPQGACDKAIGGVVILDVSQRKSARINKVEKIEGEKSSGDSQSHLRNLLTRENSKRQMFVLLERENVFTKLKTIMSSCHGINEKVTAANILHSEEDRLETENDKTSIFGESIFERIKKRKRDSVGLKPSPPRLKTIKKEIPKKLSLVTPKKSSPRSSPRKLPASKDMPPKRYAVVYKKVEEKSISADSDIPYCMRCSRSFLTSESLSKHICGIRKDRIRLTDGPENWEEYLSEISDGIKRFQCKICDLTFRFRCKCRDHIYVHINFRQHKCDICQKTYCTKQSLVNHMNYHTYQFKCDICDKPFPDRYTLTYHTRMHTKVKRFKCDICSDKFTSRHNLENHRRTHTGERPFVCEECNFTSTTNSALHQHIRVHHRERKKEYKCNNCSKQFFSKTHLRQHMYTHIPRVRKSLLSSPRKSQGQKKLII